MKYWVLTAVVAALGGGWIGFAAGVLSAGGPTWAVVGAAVFGAAWLGLATWRGSGVDRLL